MSVTIKTPYTSSQLSLCTFSTLKTRTASTRTEFTHKSKGDSHYTFGFSKFNTLSYYTSLKCTTLSLTPTGALSMISQHELKQRIDYNPDTGVITERFYASFMNDRPITIRIDANYIRIDGISYTINKIIWLYMTGEIAKGRIYTVNNIKNDKRWKNITRNYSNSHEHPGEYPPECRRPKPVSVEPEELTQDILKEYINYTPETGVIGLRHSPDDQHTVKISRGAQGKNNMYIKIQGEEYSARQLIHMYMTGEFHNGRMHTVDGDNQNLRWDNIVPKQTAEISFM